MDYLSDLEIVKVETFCKDKEMFEAVKKVLLQHIYDHGVLKPNESHNPFKNRAIALIADNQDNDKLGSNVRAWWEGINALEQGYDELTKITSKKEDGVKTPYNEAE